MRKYYKVCALPTDKNKVATKPRCALVRSSDGSDDSHKRERESSRWPSGTSEVPPRHFHCRTRRIRKLLETASFFLTPASSSHFLLGPSKRHCFCLVIPLQRPPTMTTTTTTTPSPHPFRSSSGAVAALILASALPLLLGDAAFAQTVAEPCTEAGEFTLVFSFVPTLWFLGIELAQYECGISCPELTSACGQ